MIKCLSFALLFFLPLFSNGQPSAIDRKVQKSEASSAEQLYLNYIGEESAFFNGPVYNEYGYLYAEGSPYFNDAKETRGKVVFDGLSYDARFLMFDVFKQKLVAKTDPGNEMFEVSIHFVSEFEIGDIRFVKLDTVKKWDMLPGFYEQLLTGSRVQVFCKPQKELSEEMIATSLRKSLLNHDKYYIHYNGNYYSITQLKSLYKVFPSNRDDLKKLARNRNLNFKTDIRTALIEAVKYLDNSLISQL